MAVFGSAVAALEAAVALQLVTDRLMVSGGRGRLRVGISSGDMVQEGDDWYGTAAIEAARLCAEASGGDVLVAATTVSWPERPPRTSSAARRTTVEGFDSPIGVYQLVCRRDEPRLPTTLAHAATSAFVGRGTEDSFGRAMLDRVRAGESRALLIVGEPGVGKSRLAAAISGCAATQGFAVLYGHCEEGLQAPHQPVVEAFGEWLGECPDAALARVLMPGGRELVRLWPELALRLPSLPPPTDGEPETQRWRLFDAVTSLLSTIAAERPAVLVIDDLQWAEPATLLLVRHLINASVAQVAVVMTVRTEGVDEDPQRLLGEAIARGHGDVIELSGLAVDAVTDLVEMRVGKHPSQELTQWLTEMTGGNPFFLGALLAHLEDGAVLRGADGSWTSPQRLKDVGVPEGVRAVVAQRLTNLDSHARAVLDVAAVAGEVFDLATVTSVLRVDLDETIAALDSAVRRGLVRGTDQVVWRSPTRSFVIP